MNKHGSLAYTPQGRRRRVIDRGSAETVGRPSERMPMSAHVSGPRILPAITSDKRSISVFSVNLTEARYSRNRWTDQCCFPHNTTNLGRVYVVLWCLLRHTPNGR